MELSRNSKGSNGQDKILEGRNLPPLRAPTPGREHDPSPEKALWSRLLASHPGPSNPNLTYIIRHVESLRGEAWEQLKQRGPASEDLLYLLAHVEPLADEAWDMMPGERVVNEDVDGPNPPDDQGQASGTIAEATAKVMGDIARWVADQHGALGPG